MGERGAGYDDKLQISSRDKEQQAGNGRSHDRRRHRQRTDQEDGGKQMAERMNP